MRIFISWSGDKSKAIAEIFRDWLPKVLQAVKPYFTPSDIEKGSRWNSEIAMKLGECRLGLFILTEENLLSPWLMFEAGAISKSVGNSKVCPILFGIENSDVKGPLTQFQSSNYDKIEIKKILYSINAELGENKLEEKILDEVFETWWPKLERKINTLKIEDEKNEQEIRDDRELLEEILGLVRFTSRKSYRNSKVSNYDSERFERLINEFVRDFESLFDWDWEHTKSYLFDGQIEHYISPKGTFLNPLKSDASNSTIRYSLLRSYKRLKDFMSENDIVGKELD